MKTFAEQIAAFEAQRGTKVDEQKSIMTVAAEAGETLDAEKQEKFDELQGEVEAIDSHLKRLRLMEGVVAKTAKPVEGYTPQDGSDSRDSRVVIKAPE